MNAHFEIVAVRQEPLIGSVRELFQEYEASLMFSLNFQKIQEDLASLPGEYAAPTALFVALVNSAIGGCVALRPFASAACEMKRLNMRPAFRGLEIGKALCLGAIKKVRNIGYTAMRLDTLKTMTAVRRLYASHGFTSIPPYRTNPIAGAEYLELTLDSAKPLIRIVPDKIFKNSMHVLINLFLETYSMESDSVRFPAQFL